MAFGQNECSIAYLRGEYKTSAVFGGYIMNDSREKSRYLDLALSGGSKRAYLNLFSPEADIPCNTRLSDEAKIDRLFTHNCSI